MRVVIRNQAAHLDAEALGVGGVDPQRGGGGSAPTATCCWPSGCGSASGCGTSAAGCARRRPGLGPPSARGRGIHVGVAYSGQPQSASVTEYSSSLREGGREALAGRAVHLHRRRAVPEAGQVQAGQVLLPSPTRRRGVPARRKTPVSSMSQPSSSAAPHLALVRQVHVAVEGVGPPVAHELQGGLTCRLGVCGQAGNAPRTWPRSTRRCSSAFRARRGSRTSGGCPASRPGRCATTSRSRTRSPPTPRRG